LEALENREVLHDPAPLLRREKTRWQTLIRHRARWAARKALVQRARRKKHPRRELVLAPALKVFLLCLLIGGSVVGYVWQKDQLRQLDLLIQGRQTRLNGLVQSNTALERLLVERLREVQTKQLTNRDAPKK
jgi:hypothetical protein